MNDFHFKAMKWLTPGVVGMLMCPALDKRYRFGIGALFIVYLFLILFTPTNEE